MVEAWMIVDLRRKIAEPDETTYSDATIERIIGRHPLVDRSGNEPFLVDDLTIPPTTSVNPNWTPTFDLNAAAADVWTEKAGKLAGRFDFQADGGSFNRSQQHTHAMNMARHYSARRAASSRWIDIALSREVRASDVINRRGV